MGKKVRELAEGNPEETGFSPIMLESGRYDINNIPGKKKVDLVMSGEVTSNQFIAPANMPGSKLKAMREAHEASLNAGIQKAAEGMPNEFQVGDLVKKRKKGNHVYEVEEVDAEKGCKVTKEEGGHTWIHHSKLVKVEPTE